MVRLPILSIFGILLTLETAHTVVILVILLMFAFTAYATNENLGSPGKVYDLLVEAAKKHPVQGNAGGSYLTMQSKEGAIFFVINIVGNFGTVFCDNGYYNKAIAASPVDALPGYIMGGLSWFAIPWLAATTMGLAALALESNPVFPGYPNRMAPGDVSAGLVLPTAAVAMLGSGGAVAVLLLVFMAVTSAMSAELIAVSSIFTYDFYQTYINPLATGRQLIYMSHTMVVGFAVAMAGWSTALFYIGISMGYLYLLMGVIISSAVLPATLTLMWSKQNWWAATFSPPLGLVCSLIAWLVTAQKESGELSVVSTGANNPMLAGNVVALLSPLIFVPILTYTFGVQNYDWLSMKAIRRGDDEDLALAANVDIERIPGEQRRAIEEDEQEQAKLWKAARIARWLTVFMTLALLILWPMPMYGSGYIFTKKFFTGWVVVGILWMFCSAFCVGLYPLWEGRKTSVRTFKSIFNELMGRGRPTRQAMVTEGEGSDTPPEAVSEKMMKQ
jgi:Na+/proline symporter